MTKPMAYLQQWIVDAATLIAAGEEPLSEAPPQFLEDPALAPALIQMTAAIDEATLDTNQPLYSACLFALDVCVSQLQFALENGNKRARQTMDALMDALVVAIREGAQTINFWLPAMNAFYDAQVPLSSELQDIYLVLAEEESEVVQAEGADHFESLQVLIEELSDLTTFELTAHFFAQSHPMPADFFGDLVVDLCNLDAGQDAAILTLLHPREEVRAVVMMALDHMMPILTLSAISLSRLQAIQAWLPEAYQATVTHWLREQRKKGVVFAKKTPAKVSKIQASEVDGGGAQGIFLQLKRARETRLAGLLLKNGFGIKDAWITPAISMAEVTRYCRDVLEDGVSLRRVDLDYICLLTNHFLAVTLEKNQVPGLHFLELQEELGVHFIPERLDVDALIERLSVQIEPFTEATIEGAFKRSSRWLETKSFAVSWYLENEHLDKTVNHFCYFEDGVKICRIEAAMDAVFKQDMEAMRAHWRFHFLWAALWLKAGSRKNEKVWQDSFLIAYAIHTGTSLDEIPIMQRICHRSILNSVETMRDRRTHLS